MIHALILLSALLQDVAPVAAFLRRFVRCGIPAPLRQEKPKETEAEALFRKITEKAAAKSLTWKSTARIAAGSGDLAITIEGAFKEGNKARLRYDLVLGRGQFLGG